MRKYTNWKKEIQIDELQGKSNNINTSANNQTNKNKNNITDYFVFDENENNIEQTPTFNQNIKNNEEENLQAQRKNLKYNICTFISSHKRPDLYCPSGFINGNKYELKTFKEKNKDDEEKETKKDEDDIISISSFDSYEDERNSTHKLKITRYFNIETDISLKCKICGEIGHTRVNCPNYSHKFCCRCIQSRHEDKECDKKKCFKCNKLGHKTYKCPNEDKELIVCEQCSCIGHKNNECLVHPIGISESFLLYNNFYCFNCGSCKHVLCSLIDRELPELQKEDENSIIFENNEIYPIINLDDGIENDEEILNKEIIENNCKIINQNFKNIFFCGLCGGRHKNEECKNFDKFINKYDDIRKNYGKQIIEKRKKEMDNNWLYTVYTKTNNNEDYSNINKKKIKNKIISLDEDDSSENEDCYYNFFNSNNLRLVKEKKEDNINNNNYNQRKSHGKNIFNKSNNDNRNGKKYLQQSFEKKNNKKHNINTFFDWKEQ